MRVLKIILIVLLFLCLFAGAILVFGAKFFANIKRKDQDNSRREMKLKIIGYTVFLAAFAFAIFQSMIAW